MLSDRTRFGFLSRMRRPEGIAPRVERDDVRRLGTSARNVYELSLCASITIMILVFLFFPRWEPATKIIISGQEVVRMEEIEQTRQEMKSPPPPRPPIPIEAPSDEVLEDVDIASSEMIASEDVAPPPPKSTDDEDQYFVAVEEMPEIIGGIKALLRVLEYPELAIRAQVQGTVFVLAYVNEEGEVTRTTVLKGIGAGCDEAAQKAVLGVRFVPGKQRGRPVKVKVSIPVVFRLRTS